MTLRGHAAGRGMEQLRASPTPAPKHYTLKSYGTIKRRLPRTAPTLSCTALKNPHCLKTLQHLTGLQRPVQLFIAADRVRSLSTRSSGALVSLLLDRPQRASYPELPRLLEKADHMLQTTTTLNFACLGGRPGTGTGPTLVGLLSEFC